MLKFSSSQHLWDCDRSLYHLWQMKLGVKHGEFCGRKTRICTKLFYVQVHFFACFREQGLSQFFYWSGWKSKDTSKEKARWWVLVCIKLNSLSIVKTFLFGFPHEKFHGYCFQQDDNLWLCWNMLIDKKNYGIVQKPNIQWLYVVSEDEVLTWYQQIVWLELRHLK
jgi:hypothetical protein